MPSCTGCTKPIASSTRSALSSNSVPGTGWNLSSTCTQCSFFTVPVLAGEFLRQHGEVARRAFLVARRGAQLQRPVRPRQQLVLVLGRLRHDLEIDDRDRALADRGADAVGAGVAAADHDDMLAGGEDRRRRRPAARRDAAVLLRQEVHREMDAVEVAARDRQVARLLGAAGRARRRRAPGDSCSTGSVHADMRRRNGRSRPRPPSARRGGRRGPSPS